MPNAQKPSVSTPHRAARSTGWTPTVSTSPSAHCRGGLGSRDPSSLPRRGVGRDRALPAAAPRLSSSGPRGVRQARPSSLFRRGARQGSRLFPGPVALLFRQLPRGSRQPRSLFPPSEGCGQGPGSSRGSASALLLGSPGGSAGASLFPLPEGGSSGIAPLPGARRSAL